MTKILLLNVGWSNKGNIAIVKSTMDAIENCIDDAEFILVGNEKHKFYGLDIKSPASRGLSIRKPMVTLESLFYIIKSFFIGKLNQHRMNLKISPKSKLYNHYKADIIVNSGGDGLSGENEIGSADIFFNLLYGVFLKKPVVLYGESLGYFKSSYMNRIAKFVFNRVDLILVREELSREYLKELKINKPSIHVTADPAFLLKPAPQDRVKEILQEEGIESLESPLILVNPSGMISKHMGNLDAKEDVLAQIIAKTIDDMIEKFDANILLIPHVYTPGTDDRDAITRILEKIKNKSKIKTIKGEYLPDELKGIISNADLFVGMRMHSMIGATSSYVPTLAIAYSHKTRGIIGEMLGLEDYVLEIQNLTHEKLISTISKLWDDRDHIKEGLKIKIPEIQEKSNLNGKLVKELID